MSLAYQQYWDNDEYRDGLRDELAEAMAERWRERADQRVEDSPEGHCRDLADVVMAKVFKRVKLHTWCGREGCFQPWCSPTHYRFDIDTHPHEFEPERADD